MLRRTAFLLMLVAAACTRPAEKPAAPPAGPVPSILLITLDTTRADSVGPGSHVDTPSFNAIAARGARFTQAYATAPQTLPSHGSILSGLYPAGHGVRENGRFLPPGTPLLAELLRNKGYRTGAFVSAFALARRFGLARGFDDWDEDFGADRAERPAEETTDRAIAWLARRADRPVFLWVHYYDPHFPYTPPEPFLSRYAKQPYYGEVAYMDQQLGRLVRAFEQQAPGPVAMVLVGDHGEGLGDHGEVQHGDLLYQSTMHVPFVAVGPGMRRGNHDAPVSTRSIFHTILDWAGIDAAKSLRKGREKVVAGEAMKPFLDYGWQPQVMAVQGTRKAILAGSLEVYDVVADPGETRNLAPQAGPSREMRATLRDYPAPALSQAASAIPSVDEEGRRKLASLGYVASDVKPVVRKDAPRPADMAALFPILDRAAVLFVRERYAEAVPLLEQILARDPYNLDSALRLATAQSELGHEKEALEAFRKARAIAPDSPDARLYLALHDARGREWKRAEPVLEEMVVRMPDRVAALEALAMIREREQRFGEALALRQKLFTLREPSVTELGNLGQLAMSIGQTAVAIDAFEREKAASRASFAHHLELGVLYLAAGRYPDARAELDQVAPSSPGYPMALFKRAQVSVLLGEPDAPQRIATAREGADATTRELIAHERLFQRGQ